MEFTYGLFGFEFSLELSTRPDNYLGQIETWNEAEAVSSFSPLGFLGPKSDLRFSHSTYCGNTPNCLTRACFFVFSNGPLAQI